MSTVKGELVGVTGGAGFIGSHACEALIDAGYAVRVIDVAQPPGPLRQATEVFGCDVAAAHDDLVRTAVRGCRAVFHLAGVANVNDALADPVGAVRLNTLGTARVLDACRAEGVGRLLLASTVWVYAACRRDGRPVDEHDPVYIDGSNHLYTTSKVAAEMLCWDYHRLFGQQVTVMRYGIPYGPRMRPGLVVERFVTAAMRGEPLRVMGAGDATRRFIDVRDLAAAHVAALKPQAANKTYTFDGREDVSVLQVAAAVREVFSAAAVWDSVGLAVTGPPRVEHLPARPGDYLGNRTSNHRAEEDLGWTPQVSFADGLRAYVDWRLQQGR